jgi:hypothetical protein
LIARDTVAVETPARPAIWRIVKREDPVSVSSRVLT